MNESRQTNSDEANSGPRLSGRLIPNTTLNPARCAARRTLWLSSIKIADSASNVCRRPNAAQKSISSLADPTSCALHVASKWRAIPVGGELAAQACGVRVGCEDDPEFATGKPIQE